MDVSLDAGAVEERLAAIWSEVLDGVPVGRSDNFFDLGGDSLLIIETVAIAREEGIDFSALDLIENQTVAELAARVRAAGSAPVDEAVPEDFPLTPAQELLCTAQPYPRHVTQSVLWRADGLDPGLLETALAAVVDQHDSFRLRLDGAGTDRVRLAYADGSGFALRHVDLTGHPADERASALKEETIRLQRSLDPVGGPVVRAALFDLGAAGRRLFVTAHHLAVDSASWRILRGDLTGGYRRLRLGKPLDLPARTAPYGLWAQRAATLRPADAPPDAADTCGALPWARWARGRNGGAPVRSATSVTVTTPEDVTETLLRCARAEPGVGMDSLVLAAVARAVARGNGMDRILLDIERHGRDVAVPDTDISRTTGWFTRLQTVALTPRDAPARTLVKSADHELHGAPPQFAPGAVPAALVNYLGRFTDHTEELFAQAEEEFTDDRHPDNFLTHPIEAHAAVDGTRLVTVLTCDGVAPANAAAPALATAYAAALEAMAAELRGDGR